MVEMWTSGARACTAPARSSALRCSPASKSTSNKVRRDSVTLPPRARTSWSTSSTEEAPPPGTVLGGGSGLLTGPPPYDRGWAGTGPLSCSGRICVRLTWPAKAGATSRAVGGRYAIGHPDGQPTDEREADAAGLFRRAYRPGASACRRHVRFDLRLARPRVLHLCGLRGTCPLQGARDRRERPGLHAGPAPRLRRRPHFGHRQHHPQVHERPSGHRQASTTGLRVLLLPGPLQRRGGHRRRDHRGRKDGVLGRLQRQLGPRAVRRDSSGPSSRPASCS